MKKYCIVSFCNIYILPYAKIYIDRIIQSGAECILLFWDRDNVNGNNDIFPKCIKKCYEYKFTNSSTKYDRLKGYKGAIKYFIKDLSNNHYDGVIFLQTHAAVASYNVLKKLYKNRYIVDIRDWTLENIYIYRNFEKKCIQNSYKTVISSPAYKSFLPDGDYVVAHNYTPIDDLTVKKIREECQIRKNTKQLSISFIGTIRFLEMNKKILNIFSNDNRFRMGYYGTGAEALEDYCLKNNIKNVDFFGSFPPEKTSEFYMKTNIINNLYGNHNKYLDYALSNKLYYSAQFYIPIIVCPQTYMEDISSKYNMGFVFDVNKDNEKDRLYEWFQMLDLDKFKNGCDCFLKKVKEDNEVFYRLIDDFID